MHMRTKKWARPELAACPYFTDEPEALRGHWRERFEADQPLWLELGCGKGVSTAKMAAATRGVNFIAMDISPDVLGWARRNIERNFQGDPVKNMMPREKIEKMGASAMTNEELLALILGSGCQDCDVFELSRHLAEFLSEETQVPSLERLRKIRGLGKVKATQVLACLELSGRYILSDKSLTVLSPEDIVSRLSFMKYAEQEHFVVATLNAANNVLHVHELTRGLVNKTPEEAYQFLVSGIAEQIRVAQEENASIVTKQIKLCGDMANDMMFVGGLRQKLSDCQVIPMDSFSNLRLPIEAEDSAAVLSCAGAIGAALNVMEGV